MVVRNDVSVRSVQGTRGMLEATEPEVVQLGVEVRLAMLPARGPFDCLVLAERAVEEQLSAASAERVRSRFSTIVYVGENLESTANSPEIAAS